MLKLIMHFLKKNIISIAIIAVFILLLLSFKYIKTNNYSELPPAYLSAIKDAKIDEKNEIINYLTPITQKNKNLVWENSNQKKISRILVAAWETEGQLQKGQILTKNTEGIITWVTIAPDLKHFCSKYQKTGGNLKLRLAQLLGLPPDTNKTEVAEIWISPHYLLRPSADSEITDSIAELRNSKKLKQASLAYQNWFQNQQNKFNNLNIHAYPWTGLGYTYDWGNSKAKVGLSEFIIWYNPNFKNSPPIEVKDVKKIEDYCAD